MFDLKIQSVLRVSERDESDDPSARVAEVVSRWFEKLCKNWFKTFFLKLFWLVAADVTRDFCFNHASARLLCSVCL